MSIQDSNGRGSVKTLAIRLEPGLHAELTLIAQLRDQTITDEIRQAIEAHVASVKADPELVSKADSLLADIERQAAQRRDAFARLFTTAGDDSVMDEPSDAVTKAGRRSRTMASDS